MKNHHITRICAATLLLASCTASASELTLTNTFNAGTPARADEVNQNFSDVQNAVNDNHNRLGNNETSTAANSTAITSNTARIGTIEASVTTQGEAIGANTTWIGTNSTNITTNSTAIEGHSTRISANETAIASNSTNIDSNTTAIAVNSQAIAAMSQAISIYDATHSRLGRFVSTAPLINASYTTYVHQGTVVWLLSDNGYLFALQRWYGLSVAKLLGIEYFTTPTATSDFSIAKAKLYYTTSDCSDTAYLNTTHLDNIAYSGFSPVLSVRGGFVFNVTDMSATPTAYYLPKENSAAPIAYLSSRDWNSTICTTNPATLLEFARAVLPNDAAVTGVKTGTDYSWPLTLDN